MESLTPQPVPIVDVPSFPPGPDAPEGSPIRIALRDSKGNIRIIGTLREYYRLTAIKTSEKPQ